MTVAWLCTASVLSDCVVDVVLYLQVPSSLSLALCASCRVALMAEPGLDLPGLVGKRLPGPPAPCHTPDKSLGNRK